MLDVNDFELNQFLLTKILPLLPAHVKHGNSLSIRCPICGDSKKNKTKMRGVVYTSPKVNYYCFNCDVHLTGFKLLQALAGESFRDIMSEYSRQQLSTFSSHTAKTTSVEPDKVKGAIPELTPLTKAELDYLASRKITELPHFDSLHLMNATIDNNDFIFIPWLSHNDIVSYQLNNFTKVPNIPKYKFQKHADKCVYGLDRIDQAFKYVICFEGVFDSIFVKNGVSIGGANLMHSQEAEIRRRYPKHEIVLAFDADKTGLEATAKYIDADSSLYKYFIWFNSCAIKDINAAVIAANDINKFANTNIANMIYSGIETRFVLSSNNLWPY